MISWFEFLSLSLDLRRCTATDTVQRNQNTEEQKYNSITQRHRNKKCRVLLGFYSFLFPDLGPFLTPDCISDIVFQDIASSYPLFCFSYSNWFLLFVSTKQYHLIYHNLVKAENHVFDCSWDQKIKGNHCMTSFHLTHIPGPQSPGCLPSIQLEWLYEKQKTTSMEVFLNQGKFCQHQKVIFLRSKNS
jgi:hypothetical protein